MAPPKKTDALKRNIALIRQSSQWRQNEGFDDLWTRMVDLYRGKHYAKSAKEDRMLVNLAFATKNVIAPSVAINNPKFTVNARKPEGAATAIITEQVLNYLWRANKYQEDFRLAVDDFLVIGHGWCKVGYKATKPPVVTDVSDFVEDSDEDQGVDDREAVVGNTESEVRNLVDNDRPFIERISPFDVFVDPDCRHPKEMKWIAQRTKRPLADVLVDSRYLTASRKKVNANHVAQRIDDQNRGIDGAPNQNTTTTYVDVWEFYDIRKNLVSTFCLEAEDAYLIEPEVMPYPFGHPFVMVRNYEVPDHFYPMGELEAMEELQQELNATRSQMMNHRKRYQRKVLYDKDAFEQDGIDALRSDADNTLVPVDLSTAQANSIAEVIGPMPQMGTPPDFYNQSDLIASDIDRVTGVSDYMRGAQAEIRRTATEAAMIQDAQNARAADKLSRIEHVLSDLGSRVVQLMQQYMTGEMVVRIVGMNSNPVWIQLDADFIKGEFDFEVEGGSTQPRNESFRRQSALQLVDALGPFIQMGVVNPQAVARHVLQFGFDVKDPDQFLMMMEPQVDPATGEPVADPMMGAPTPEMPQGVESTSQEEAVAESPVEGIPPELIAQLMGQQGLAPN